MHRMTRWGLVLVALSVLYGETALGSNVIRGTTRQSKSGGAAAAAAAAVVVALYRLNSTESLSDWAVYTSNPFQRRVVPAASCSTVETEVVCPFVFSALPAGAYSVVAWSDVAGDTQLHTERHAPLGWCASEPAGPIARLEVDGSSAGAAVECSAALWASSAWPSVPSSVAHGKLFDIDGIHVLHTWGTPAERGRAQGMLLGRQVVDFFRAYILERDVKSARRYEAEVLPWLRKYISVPAELAEEMQGVADGVLQTVQDPIPELGRRLSYMDVLAINAYIEAPWIIRHPELNEAGNNGNDNASPGACTQFVFWGKEWTGADGETIAARNMDGEIDLRRVTVTHFLAHASEPSPGSGGRRTVSMMWPGFVGTLSGVDEAGNYAMENAGRLSRNYTSVAGESPGAWMVQQVLRLMPQEYFARPADAEKWLLTKLGGPAGGVAPAGSILVVASNASGWIYEADRYGGVMRSENMAAPFIPGIVMASNHFLLYGAGPEGWNFGQQASFSSLWRYASARYKVEAWRDAGTLVDVQRAKELLQLVCEGETEHSIIWQPQARTLHVAVATAEARMWNAPYGRWITLPFDAFFA